MPYNQFSLNDLKTQFSLTMYYQSLFKHTPVVSPSAWLTEALTEQTPIAKAIHTEKARSELIVTPILVAFRRLVNRQLSLFSGTDFPVDASQGLTGVADFMVCASPQQLFIEAPIIIVVEAKNDNLKNGLGQCGATMLAAQLFNQAQHDYPANVIYGAVTTGTNWQFLKLEETTLYIDLDEYYANQVDKILGILLSMVEPLGITISTPTN